MLKRISVLQFNYDNQPYTNIFNGINRFGLFFSLVECVIKKIMSRSSHYHQVWFGWYLLGKIVHTDKSRN
jgi:hypothetical protein